MGISISRLGEERVYFSPHEGASGPHKLSNDLTLVTEKFYDEKTCYRWIVKDLIPKRSIVSSLSEEPTAYTKIRALKQYIDTGHPTEDLYKSPINIVSQIQEKLKITIPDEDLKDIVTIGDMVTYLVDHLQKN